MKVELGGKGANLAEMTNLGVPVPPGFTIASSQCIEYLQHGGVSDEALRDEVSAALSSSRRRRASVSATRPFRCSCPSDPVRRSPCPA